MASSGRKPRPKRPATTTEVSGRSRARSSRSAATPASGGIGEIPAGPQHPAARWQRVKQRGCRVHGGPMGDGFAMAFEGRRRGRADRRDWRHCRARRALVEKGIHAIGAGEAEQVVVAEAAPGEVVQRPGRHRDHGRMQDAVAPGGQLPGQRAICQRLPREDDHRPGSGSRISFTCMILKAVHTSL